MVNAALPPQPTDPRLGRLEEFDERSRLFQIAPLLAEQGIIKPRSYTWSLGPQLNQANSGRCVAYMGAGDLGARPVKWPVTNELANALYELCTKRDAWSQNDNGDINFGTSVLALMKVFAELGFISEYRWAGAGSGKALEDFSLSLSYKGPVLLGTVWYNSMFNVLPDGHIIVDQSSGVAGGHAYLPYRQAIAWKSPLHATFDDVDRLNTQVHIRNSWGGQTNGWMTLAEIGHLLSQNGEAAIPIMRTRTS